MLVLSTLAATLLQLTDPGPWVVTSSRQGVSLSASASLVDAVRGTLVDAGWSAPPTADLSRCLRKLPCLLKEAREAKVTTLVVVESARILDESVVKVDVLLVEEDGRKIASLVTQAASEQVVKVLADQVRDQVLPALGPVPTAPPAPPAPEPVAQVATLPTTPQPAAPPVPNFFGVTVLAVGGLQVRSEVGRRGSIGAEVDLTFRRGRFDGSAGVVIGPNVGARVAASWALLDGRLRLGPGVRGTVYPGLSLFGGGLSVVAEFALNSIFGVTAVGAAEVYPEAEMTSVVLLGSLGVAARF